MATIFTLILISIYIVILVACIAYYWRFQRQHANVIMHGLIPVLGIAVFVPVFLTAAGIPAFKFVTPLAYPISLAGPVVGVWMVIGDRVPDLPGEQAPRSAGARRRASSSTSRRPPRTPGPSGAPAGEG